jgi:hypothetical protein
MFSKRLVVGLFGALVLVASVGVVTPPVVAQIRAALVRDADSPVRGTRHLINETYQFAASSFFVSDNITPTIPAGKKLFVQNVSIHSFLTDGQDVMEARLSVNGEAFLYVPQPLQAISSSSAAQRHFNGNAEANVLINPGDTVNVFLFRNNNLGSASLNFSRVVLNGYLVDATP